MPVNGDSPLTSSTAARRRTAPPARRMALMVAGAAACAAVAWTVTGLALAAGSSPTLKAARTTTLGEVVVNSAGRTVYALAPETTHHLLCTSSQCLHFWPPVTVRSARASLKAGRGVTGHLGILRRANGMLQVTLAGRPLYRFLADSAKGQTSGQGVVAFGGRWHVITARATGGSAPKTTQQMSTTTSTVPAYPSSTVPGY